MEHIQAAATPSGPSDVIFAIQDPYLSQIIEGTKSYEFRKYRLEPSIKRIWFYHTKHSSITHICEILPARTRDPGELPLEEDGLGNKEFNMKHKDWEGYDFAYKILSVYEIEKPLSLLDLIEEHGLQSAPKGLTFLPNSISHSIIWSQQKRIR